ncbi:MAG: hypothetical protein PHC61_12705 [Chitinivibrionales bacterium]|nr:hypothetical protein [Chitinivibrionales bacterium]
MKKIMTFLAIAGLGIFTSWASQGYDDLAKLVKSGVSEDVIIAFINTSGTGYVLTADEILQLKDMGASGKVITAAIQRKKPATDSGVQKSAAVANAGQPAVVPSVNPDIIYESVPPAGGWVLMNGYWYWQYPTGVIVDLGWQPYYSYHRNWYPYRHWGRGHRGWR